MADEVVVCDTNVWYDLAGGSRVTPGSTLIGTLINLIELTRSNWLPDRIDIVRGACKQILLRHREIRIDTPMVYVARISEIESAFDSERNADNYLKFVIGLAEDDELSPKRLDEFRSVLKRERDKTIRIAEELNQLTMRVREMRINKRDPQYGQDYDSTRRLIASMVSINVKRDVGVEEINWDEIELFFSVTHALHVEMEISKRKFQPNDIGDQYNLVYVGKGESYWTSEKRWIRNIQSAGMGHYLVNSA